jgi:hypothetical protein
MFGVQSKYSKAAATDILPNIAANERQIQEHDQNHTEGR